MPEERAERPRDTIDLDASRWVGGSSDIGQRHATNQDYLVISVRNQRAVLVVSDGVSTSQNAEQASQTAARSAAAFLQPVIDGDEVPDEATMTATLVHAFAAAHDDVLADGVDGEPVGSCTLVAAVVLPNEAWLGNLGDTRAYWLADDGNGSLLTVDDSVAQAQIEMGMPREEAENGVHAHAITKWLGPTATDIVPRVRRLRVDRPGWVVICSDGLWNYASTPPELGHVVRQIWAAMPESDPPVVLTKALVGWANAQGGRDNITVAIARVGDGLTPTGDDPATMELWPASQPTPISRDDARHDDLGGSPA